MERDTAIMILIGAISLTSKMTSIII